MTALDRTNRIADIVLEHPECARVFQGRRIDFCCRGEMTLDEACAARGLPPGEVLTELREAIAAREGDGEQRLDRLPTDALVARIVERHHAYLRTALPFLDTLAAKVARVHGDHNPKLRGVYDVVRELRAELEPHLDHEEQVLFPALTSAAPDASVVGRELTGMREDHARVGAALERMRDLADDFAAPEWACNSYRTLMRELAQLEADTLQHVHAENHVLMPRFA